MKKISGHVVSTKTTTLSRAAEIVSRFAAVDNGSSPAVSLYLQRTADAFNHLVHFHDKRSKLVKLETSPKLQTEKSNSENKKDNKTFNDDLQVDEAEISVKKKNKKKKRKSDDNGDMKEKSSKQKKS